MNRTRIVPRLPFLAALLVVGSCNEKIDPKIVEIAEAARLSITQQPSATVQNAAVLPVQPIVQLVDEDGVAIAQAGVEITVAAGEGGGTLGGAPKATTGADGQATFSGLSITGTAGAHKLVFNSVPLVGAVSNPIALTPGPATSLSIQTQPSATAQLGVAFATQPEVRLLDVSGNQTGPANVAVTVAKASGNGTLGGTTTANTSASGLASFAGLLISDSLGAHTLSFSALTLASVTSATINVTAGAASQITVTRQPSAVIVSGVPFAEQPIIQLRDPQGNAVAQAGVAVIATIFSGGGTLNGTTSVNTDAKGAATFTNLSVTGSDGTRVLRFTGGGFVVNSITLSMGGTGSVAGSITLDGGSTALTGGFVELLDGSTVVSTATVSASGTYSIGPISVKSYSLRYQPPLTHSIGTGELVTKPVNISTNTTSTVDFKAQPAVYSDDFQSYTNVSDITYGALGIKTSLTPGKFGYTPAGLINYVRTVSQGDHTAPYGVGGDGLGLFALPATEGPFNDKAFRYTWAASPNNTPGGKRTPPGAADISNYYVKQEFRTAVTAFPAGTSEVWLRFTDKLSSNFRVGGAGATGSEMEYKYFFISISTNKTGSSYAPVQIELDDQNTNPSPNIILRTKLIDHTGGSAIQRQSKDQNLAANFLGGWHTWVVGITGIGTANALVSVYLDGVLFTSVTGSYLAEAGTVVGGSATDIIFEMGANINNGPDQEQYRWWREIGVYKSRPSLKPLVP
jgi:hypothetical protein